MTPLELILDEIRRTPERVVPKNALALPDRAPMRLRCEVLPPSSDPIPEDAPPELAALWRLCGGVEVWKDIIFGQWGLEDLPVHGFSCRSSRPARHTLLAPASQELRPLIVRG